jgi:transcriptional regulator with XRE-family HTH domain
MLTSNSADESASKRPISTVAQTGPMTTSAQRRAQAQAAQAGQEIAAARAEHGMSRAHVGRRAGVSPDTERRVEEGDPGVQIATLCAVAEAVGIDIVIRSYRGRQPTLRDSGQMLVAEQLLAIAHDSWERRLELTAGDHGEAADIGLFGATEIIDLEIDRLLHDFQDRYRRNAQKRDWIAAHHERPVRLVMVVEDSPRNREAVAPHAALIRSVLPAGSREILGSLRHGRPLGRDGLLWVRRRQPPEASRRRYIGDVRQGAASASRIADLSVTR